MSHEPGSNQVALYRTPMHHARASYMTWVPTGLPGPHTDMYGFYSPQEIRHKLNSYRESETARDVPWYKADAYKDGVWWYYVPDGAPENKLESFGPNDVFRVVPNKVVQHKRNSITGWDSMTRNEQAWNLINTYPAPFWMGRDPRAILELHELSKHRILPPDVASVLSDRKSSERNRRQWLRFWDRCRGDTMSSRAFIFEWMAIPPPKAMPLLAEGDLEMALTIARAVTENLGVFRWSMDIPGKKQAPQRIHSVARLYPDSISRGVWL